MAVEITTKKDLQGRIQYGYESCPSCGASLDGGMIPVERRGLLGGATRYSLLIPYEHTSGLVLTCPQCHDSCLRL